MNDLRKLRDNPPVALRSAFFPEERAKLKGRFKSSPAFLRPMLKTDQGTAGNFLGFRIESGSSFPQRYITEETGLAIPEVFFLQSTEQLPEVRDLALEVQRLFAAKEEDKAYLALETLEQKCIEENIDFRRNSDKGRLPFFFIRPVQAGEGSFIVPESVTQDITVEVQRLIYRTERTASAIKQFMRVGLPLSKAISEGIKIGSSLNTDILLEAELLYFQPDVIIRNNGTFVIDRINFPDVGFFLTKIDPGNNDVLKNIQGVVSDLQEVVINTIVEKLKECKEDGLVLMTRDSVIDNNEDTLEHMELEAIGQALARKNIKSEVRKLSEIKDIKTGITILLMNVSPQDPNFESLLRRSVNGEINCYPDPFILLIKDSIHTYTSTTLQSTQLNNLRAIIEPLDVNEKHPELVYRQIYALRKFLEEIGFTDDEDIFYFTDCKGKIAPAFKYDLRGFSLALREFEGVDSLEIRGLNFIPQDAVIEGQDGPRLAAFRFMFIKK